MKRRVMMGSKTHPYFFAKAGDVLCSDKSVLSVQDYKSSGKTASGIVFWVNPNPKAESDFIRAVALYEHSQEEIVYGNGSYNMPKYYSSQSEALNAMNGYECTQAIRAAYLTGTDNRETIQWYLNTYNAEGFPPSQWYLPALGEVKLMFTREINQVLVSLGFQEFKIRDGWSHASSSLKDDRTYYAIDSFNGTVFIGYTAYRAYFRLATKL